METYVSPRSPSPLKTKVFHPDIQGIQITSIEDASIKITEASQKRSRALDDTVNEEHAAEMRMWWEEAIAKDMDMPDGYQRVSVLLIKWADELDELKTREETEELETLFRERFHFQTNIVELNFDKKPQLQMNRYLSTFIEQYDEPNGLIIIYYTGRGVYREDLGHLRLSASLKPTAKIVPSDYAHVNWNKSEEILRSDDLEADVLTILDTVCSGSPAKRDKGGTMVSLAENEKEDTRTFESFSAYEIDGMAVPGERSFTRVLIDALTALAKEFGDRSFTTFHLNQRILLDPRRSTGSHFWFRLQQHQRLIRLTPLKAEKGLELKSPLRLPPQGYLTLRLGLRDKSLNQEQIEFIARNLVESLSNKQLVGLRTVDWLEFKPARATYFSRAALALFVIGRWRKFVSKRREEKQLMKRTPSLSVVDTSYAQESGPLAFQEHALHHGQNWRSLLPDIPDAICDNLEYRDIFGSGLIWTCTPSKDTPMEQIPLTISGHPVVIPVEYHYPASAFTMPPPDPHHRFIDPSKEIDEDTVNEIFENFEHVLGFYLLINGMLQLIVPDDFDFEYALSHQPNEFGGLRVSHIPQSMTPTAERRDGSSSISVEQPSSLERPESLQKDTSPSAKPTQAPIQPHMTSSSSTSSAPEPGRRGPMDLKIGSMVQARVEGGEGTKATERFQGKIGLMTEANNHAFLVVSSHILTQALVATKSSRFPGIDWKDGVRVMVSNGGPWTEIGRISETFDPHARTFPHGFLHDISLVDVTSAPKHLVAGIASPMPTDWLSQSGWSSIKYTTQNLFLLDSPDIRTKSIGILGSQCQMVGQAIFKLREQSEKKTRFRFPFAHKKSDVGTEIETWTSLVSRSLLYRVDPALRAPGALSGAAVCIHEDLGDHVSSARVAGFSSWAQPVSDITRFEMEGRKFYNRLEEGSVAFYGAFQAPYKLRDEHRIV